MFLGLIAFVAGTSVPGDATALGMSTLLGLIGAGAYFAYFTGLRIGPISVVSGMVAAYGGLTVVLSVVLRGESLTGLQALGATVATIGVIMTGVAFDGGLRATRFAGPGVVFAVVALVLFAMMAITMDIALETPTGSRSCSSRGWSSRSVSSSPSARSRSPAQRVHPIRAASGRRSVAWRSMLVIAGCPRRHRADLVRHRPVERPDLAGRARVVVRPGRHDPRRRRRPRRTAQADPVVRAGRRGDRDDRDRPAVSRVQAGRLNQNRV